MSEALLIEALRQAREFVDYVHGSYVGGGRVITFSEEDREWMEAILCGKKYYPQSDASETERKLAESVSALQDAASDFNRMERRTKEIEEWASAAFDTIRKGVTLMPLDQLSEWSGVRTTMEAFPLEFDPAAQPAKNTEGAE